MPKRGVYHQSTGCLLCVFETLSLTVLTTLATDQIPACGHDIRLRPPHRLAYQKRKKMTLNATIYCLHHILYHPAVLLLLLT